MCLILISTRKANHSPRPLIWRVMQSQSFVLIFRTMVSLFRILLGMLILVLMILFHTLTLILKLIAEHLNVVLSAVMSHFPLG